MITPRICLLATVTLCLLSVIGMAAEPAGTSLLKNPNPTLTADNEKAPFGSWCGVGTGSGKHLFVKDGNDIVVRQSSDGIARLQYGVTSVLGDALKPYWGSVVEVSAEVRGKVDLISPDGNGISLVMDISGSGSGVGFSLGPKTKIVNGKSQAEKFTGSLEWTTLRTTFRVPQNTEKIALLMYLHNGQGKIEWRRPKLVVAPEGTKPEQELPAAFLSGAEARAAVLEKFKPIYEKRLDEMRQYLKAPAAASLYEVPADLARRRPRVYFDQNVTPAVFSARVKNPAYAHYVKRVKEQTALITEYLPQLPTSHPLNNEDPLRGWADSIPVLAMSALIAPTSEERAKQTAVTVQWIESIMRLGVTNKNLPLAQFQLAFACAYDWLYSDLSDDVKTRMRQYMLAMARKSFDLGDSEVNWVLAAQYLANHNWFNYSGRLFTAITLWGEPGVDEAELRNWLDLSVENYWIISQTHPRDGLPIEGFLYGDYGARPYFDASTLCESNLKLKFTLLEHDAIKNMGHRLQAILPNRSGFMVYSDSKPAQFSTSFLYHFVASKFHDPLSQHLATVLDSKAEPSGDFMRALTTSAGFTDINTWRNFFWFDPSVSEIDEAKVPLQYDAGDLGIFLTRSSWNADASFVGLRCGPTAGNTTSSKFGLSVITGHAYPEQGSFSFYVGATDVIPGCDYARMKMTTNHSLVVFEGRDTQQGQWVGQVGEGASWFGNGTYKYARLKREAKVTRTTHEAKYDQYLCDLGGLYLLADTRAPNKEIFPEYRRNITFIRSAGVVIIADRVRVEQPRTIKFRLLTGGQTIRIEGNDFLVNFKDKTAKIRNLLTSTAKPEASEEELLTWGKNHRAVASLITSPDTKEALFVVAVGLEKSADGISLQQVDGKMKIALDDLSIPIVMD